MNKLKELEEELLKVETEYKNKPNSSRKNNLWEEYFDKVDEIDIKISKLIDENSEIDIKDIIRVRNSLNVIFTFLLEKQNQVVIDKITQKNKEKAKQEHIRVTSHSSSKNNSDKQNEASKKGSVRAVKASSAACEVQEEVQEVVVMERFDIVNKRVIANIQVFNGGTGENVRNELKIFLDNCKFVQNSLEDTQADRTHFLAGLKSRFRGDAYELVKKSNPITFDLLETLLLDTYLPERTLAEVSQALYSCKQNVGETTRCFLRRLKNQLADIKALLERMFPANNQALIAYQEQEAIDIFKRGTRNAGLRQHLLLSAAGTLNDLGAAAKLYEDAERKLRTNPMETNTAAQVNAVTQEYNRDYIGNYQSNNLNNQDVFQHRQDNRQGNYQRGDNDNQFQNNYKRNQYQRNYTSGQFQNNFQRNYPNEHFQNNNQQGRINNQRPGEYGRNFQNSGYRNYYPQNQQYNQVQFDYTQNQRNFRGDSNYQRTNQQPQSMGNNSVCELCGNKGHNVINCALKEKMGRNWNNTPNHDKQISDNLNQAAVFCEGCGLAGHKMDQCPTLRQSQRDQAASFSGNEAVQVKSANQSAQ